MQNLANWIQAISTAILALLTVWVVFYSEVGDLAIQLLQSELWETKQEMKVIFDEKEELENQKKRLQDERNELARQREEHLVHVVNGRLGDLWLFGARTLAAYRKVTELSQELLDLTEKVEIYRDWNESNEVASIRQAWMFYLPVPEEISTYKRSDWGELLIDMNDGSWECSKGGIFSIFSYEDVKFDPQGTKRGTKKRARLYAEWQQNVQAVQRRRVAEYHLSCFDEWESVVRQHIQAADGETALNIQDFSERLLEWPGITTVSKEVKDRIKNKLMSEISNNSHLANLTIQLQVSEGASLQEIAEEARQVESNVKIARDWLDEATKDRHMWTTD